MRITSHDLELRRSQLETATGQPVRVVSGMGKHDLYMGGRQIGPHGMTRSQIYAAIDTAEELLFRIRSAGDHPPARGSDGYPNRIERAYGVRYARVSDEEDAS